MLHRKSLVTLSNAIEHLGTGRFAPALLQTIDAPVDHLALIHLGENDSVHHICSTNRPGFNLDEVAQRLYFTLYYRDDPNRGWIQKLDHEVQVVRLLPQEIGNPEYQQLWYTAMGIKDRISVLSKADMGLYCCNFYRMSQPFSDHEQDEIIKIAPVLSALTTKHTRLAGALSSFQTRESQLQDLQNRLDALDAGLTERECQVCSRILLGMTSEGIGLDLEITTQTVQTFRKRAYARLGISSQNELFALCLIGKPK